MLNWLKETRAEAHMTGDAVSRKVGISPQHYNFIENGKRRPSVSVAKRIAEVLGFEWTKFFEESERDDVGA